MSTILTIRVSRLHMKSYRAPRLISVVFMSPLPNPKLWNQATVGKLQQQECFGKGGWWHDERILAATGEGLEKEEPKAWEGWWNEQVVCNSVYALRVLLIEEVGTG